MEARKIEPPEHALASFIVDNDVLIPALKKLRPCMSKDDARYQLQGICLESNGEKLLAVATNGHMLGYIELPVAEESVLTPFTAIISAPTVKSLIGMLSKESRCILTVFDSKIMFDWETSSLETQLIEGEYPNWRLVVSEKLLKLDVPAVAFDPKYLAALCKSISGTVGLKIGRADDAVLLQDSLAEGARFLLMPKRWTEAMQEAEAARMKAEEATAKAQEETENEEID